MLLQSKQLYFISLSKGRELSHASRNVLQMAGVICFDNALNIPWPKLDILAHNLFDFDGTMNWISFWHKLPTPFLNALNLNVLSVLLRKKWHPLHVKLLESVFVFVAVGVLGLLFDRQQMISIQLFDRCMSHFG